MESLFNLLQSKQIEKKKTATYRWQEVALEIIKELRLEKKDQWLVWRLYKLKGEAILNSLLGEINQGEIKGNPIIYLKWLLKSK